MYILIPGCLITMILSSQGAQSRGWWWLTCGATCPCWITGTWFREWQWPAAGTAAWYTMASSTLSEASACLETWTMWRGREHWFAELPDGKGLTGILQLPQNRWILSNPDSLNKYSHYTAENTADGGARVGMVQHIEKVSGRVSCKSRSCGGTRHI